MRQFAVATVVWGIVGMLVGVVIVAQLYWPTLLEDMPWLGYGRLRPRHPNAVIFALWASLGRTAVDQVRITDARQRRDCGYRWCDQVHARIELKDVSGSVRVEKESGDASMDQARRLGGAGGAGAGGGERHLGIARQLADA